MESRKDERTRLYRIGLDAHKRFLKQQRHVGKPPAPQQPEGEEREKAFRDFMAKKGVKKMQPGKAQDAGDWRKKT